MEYGKILFIDLQELIGLKSVLPVGFGNYFHTKQKNNIHAGSNLNNVK